MGYHATLPVIASSNSSENEISPETTDVISTPQPGKYFLATGRDFPFCRKYLRTTNFTSQISKQYSFKSHQRFVRE